eukprot:1987970-Pyramimonas_sp.AAC.2
MGVCYSRHHHNISPERTGACQQETTNTHSPAAAHMQAHVRVVSRCLQGVPPCLPSSSAILVSHADQPPPPTAADAVSATITTWWR